MLHWGIAKGQYDTVTQTLKIHTVDVSEPDLPKGKQVRQNSKDLEAARQHTVKVVEACREAQAIFVEVPHGSQSARAMAGYAICVGILGALRGGGITFYEVTAMEVKRVVSTASKTPKQEMIDWAMAKHPEVSWPRYKKNGELLLRPCVEHMADAVITIYAGLNTTNFQQAIQMLK